MKRREFITLLGGAAVARPMAARAQQSDGRRRVGVLMNVGESDVQGRARLDAFVQRLKELGWSEGRNLRLDVCWGAGDAELFRRYANELLVLAPDVIVANASVTVAALQQVTRQVPIVFAGVIDPVGGGFVKSLARPGGNTTGFTIFEYAIGAKWLELLKGIAPSLTREAVLRDPTLAAGIGQFAAIQAVGPVGMDLSVIDLNDANAIERDVAEFAQGSNGGLILTGSPFGANHPDVIIALAARHKLPAIYPFRYMVNLGGLISYGPDLVNEFRPAAGYVDRILKGGRPSDLPVQAPTKYELVVNMKTAKALGIEVPPTLLARADEVIE